ncbi:hypothetical protein PVAND_002344 [Polypedilum vanderplanki]|uniref:GLTSCR protein conserved domain-containing protein n=1 Tax=Polypedilum vanderplanki TaxID=319348 RepID=A0A9J6BR17_POLVA|nr:hypothetical protein PVAND_002344 [Polypedilum vanderplanki]
MMRFAKLVVIVERIGCSSGMEARQGYSCLNRSAIVPCSTVLFQQPRDIVLQCVSIALKLVTVSRILRRSALRFASEASFWRFRRFSNLIDLPCILSPSGPFLTPSQSPSIQHSPRLQPSPSQSPFQQQDVLLVTNNSQHFINTFSTTQEQDRKSGTPNRRLSLNHIQSPNAGTTQIVYRPSPTQSPANLGIVNEINTTLVGSNNISLNKKGKRTPNANQYGTTIPSSNACSPKATKKGASILVGSPIASPSPSASPQPMIQQFPMMNANNSIVFMQQPASHRASLIQANTQQSNFIASSSNTSNVKQNKAPQQILPKPTSSSSSTSGLGTSASTPSLITSTTSTKQIVTQSKMAIVQQQTAPNQTQQTQFQSPPHQSTQIITSTGNESPSSQQIAQGGIILPSGAQPLLLNQMPVLVQQNTAQGVQFFIQRPQPTSQLATPSLVIHNRPQMQQSQPQMLRILNTNAPMQLATATAAAPAFIVSSQANIIQQNLQSIKTPTNNSNSINQISGLQQNQQQTSRQPQQIIANSHILGQSVAQIQNLQLNGNLTQIQMPNGQIIQQLPAQFSTQNLGSFNQIQPIGSQLATFQSPPQSSNSQGDIVPTSNPIQFTTNQSNQIAMAQGAQIISPVATPQPQIIQSDSILSSPPSIAFNSQPQTVIVTGDKQIHEISSPPPFSIIQQATTGNAEIINLDLSQQSIQQQQPQPIVNTKPARKPKKSKKKQALELAQQQAQQQQQAQMSATITIPSISTPTNVNEENINDGMLSPSRNSNNNSQAPTGKLDLANVIKLCGIMEDDDFLDSDEQMMESMENQQQQQQQQIEQTQTIRAENSSNNTGSDQIMITIPSGTADQPFTFTIPSSSLENVTADGTILHQASNEGGAKMGENVPLMIRFDGDAQNGSQPFTISVPNLTEDNMNMIEDTKQDDGGNNTNPISCVPSFVNQVLNSSVTPTIQSQINEIQNQLMALPPVQQSNTTTTTTVSPTKAAKTPRQRKQTTKKSKKQLQLELQQQQQQQQMLEKTIEVPTQIGNIQISQIDGTTMKNTIGKNINNQIQIMPILDKNQSTGVLMEKQKLQVPIMQQTISQHQQSNQHGSNNNNNNSNNNSNNNKQHNPPPSQVNINVQQNQLINVTNNLQMQVIANPQQQHNNATPAPPPSSSSQNNNSSQSQTAQNIIGNIINAQQGQQGGNIIIQGTSSFNQQQPANIQVNIQNQTIANNINNNVQQQQPTAQSILSQLTGNLVLSLSEDGRLILRHDPNIPQDAQSQMILQTILTGALGNVSLINEPLKTAAANQQQTPQHIINANGKIQQISTVQNKNVIITNQPQSQQQQQPIFNNVMQTQSVQSGQIIHNASSQPIQVQSNNQQQQQKVMSTPNIIKFVELPKIQPNQQLFSLNTVTNEITLLNPNQTTAALSPMERLLIVPSGINAQQLAQCLSQGQIHFNNIGQAPTSDPNKVQQHLQIQQQIQMQQQMTFKTNVQKVAQNIKKEPTETKPKKARGKKAKLLEEQQQQQLLQQVKMEIKKEPIQSPPPMKMITTQAQVSIADTKVIKNLSTTTIAVTSISATVTNSTAKNTITISPSSNSNTMTKVNTTTKVNATKINNKNSISVIPTEILLPNAALSSPAVTKVVKGSKAQQIKTVPQQTPPPPLVSVNQAPLPRVQTIQLTPQKQQSLKNVQMQIQQLSGRLQNKNLLATLTADIDLNNPAFSKPLPVLTNIHSMTDTEIYETLQRLFVEQQKILATGKIIPTIPAAVSPVTGNQSTVRPNATQSLFVNNQNIVAPISAASTPSGVSLYSGGNCGQKVPSPIQVNSPIVKQEPPCSASTTSSQPPPLVVSTPIQMQIKTEILSSPNSGGGNSIPIQISAPPATGSIIISPKYTTSQPSVNKIPTTIEQLKEQKVPVDSKLDIVVPAQANEIAIEPSAIIKQQQIAAVELNQKKKVTRSSLFERQICVDQDGCTKADVKTDFICKEDAVKRLIRYHCMYEEIKDENDPKEDYEFSEQAKLFLASFQTMKEKYQHLLLKQSQQHAPTSELMMLDRLQVADLKDEIVSMQREINAVMQEQQQQQESQVVVKSEPSNNFQSKPQVLQTQSSSNVSLTAPNPLASSTQRHYNPMQEPSQILKAKQEQKLFENIKNEISEFPKENRKSFGMLVNSSSSTNSLSNIQSATSPKSPTIHHHNQQQPQTNQSQKVMSKFDKLKSESMNAVQPPPPQQQIMSELKDDLDDLDIESEIHSNFIMKKCEPVQSQQHQSLPSPSVPTKKSKTAKEKEKEREFSPLSDYLNSVKIELMPIKNNNKMNENVKNETHDGAYDEWLSIQKELNLHLDTTSCSKAVTKRKDAKNLKIQSTSKTLESDLSDIFENHNNSPKSVEKQLDDLFSSTSKTNDLLSASSPPELNELFHVEKTVENRLEALFGEDENVKTTQQDLVETRLEQLFQSGSVNPNDESALDNASFLYKNSDLMYDEMIEKQVPVPVSNSSSNKRQWSGNSCGIYSNSNSSIIFPSSPTTSKRACTGVSVSFDNKWIDDSFDFGSDIANMATESTSDDIAKQRAWNGGLDHHHHQFQIQMQTNDSTNLHNTNHNMPTQSQQQQPQQSQQQQQQVMDTSMNYDDVDDISRQVQNAIDSILNLQSSDPLHYQLDPSFLELNAITSSSPNSPVVRKKITHYVHPSISQNLFAQLTNGEKYDILYNN